MEHCDWPGEITWSLGDCKITVTPMPGNGDRFGPRRKDAEQQAVIAPPGPMEMWWREAGCGEPLAVASVPAGIGSLHYGSSCLACMDLALDLE